nr:MAG TPA: helix-turn-helix domain protein [Caudoviricetes sp.]
MNQRQRKKQFKKLHGMNPKQYFLEKAMPEIVKVVVDVANAMIKVLCKLNGTLWEIARVRMANANLLKNLTEQRKQGKRKKGKWSK